MLILQRKPRESFYIGDNIQVIVLGVRGNQIRIGIKAPKGIRVDREEIRERIKRELADPDGNTMDPIDDEAITPS